MRSWFQPRKLQPVRAQQFLPNQDHPKGVKINWQGHICVTDAWGREVNLHFGDWVMRYKDGSYGVCPDVVFRMLYEKRA